MENYNNINQCGSVIPQSVTHLINGTQKIKSHHHRLNNIKSICRSIIKGCERDQVDQVIHQVDQLSNWLEQIDETDILGYGKHEAGEMIAILQLVHQANSVVISKGFTMAFNNT